MKLSKKENKRLVELLVSFIEDANFDNLLKTKEATIMLDEKDKIIVDYVPLNIKALTAVIKDAISEAETY